MTTETPTSWKRIEDGYESLTGRAKIFDNGGGFGPAEGAKRWAVEIDGRWLANVDTLDEAKQAALDFREVTIFGPNLSGPAQRKGYMHVHAADCGDCKHYGPGRKFGGEDEGWTILVTSRADVVREIYPPGDFGYDGETEWEGFDDLYVAPCLKLK